MQPNPSSPAARATLYLNMATVHILQVSPRARLHAPMRGSCPRAMQDNLGHHVLAYVVLPYVVVAHAGQLGACVGGGEPGASDQPLVCQRPPHSSVSGDAQGCVRACVRACVRVHSCVAHVTPLLTNLRIVHACSCVRTPAGSCANRLVRARARMCAGKTDVGLQILRRRRLQPMPRQGRNDK